MDKSVVGVGRPCCDDRCSRGLHHRNCINRSGSGCVCCTRYERDVAAYYPLRLMREAGWRVKAHFDIEPIAGLRGGVFWAFEKGDQVIQMGCESDEVILSILLAETQARDRGE